MLICMGILYAAAGGRTMFADGKCAGSRTREREVSNLEEGEFFFEGEEERNEGIRKI